MRIVPATTYRNDLCTPVVTLLLRDDPRAPGRVRVVLRDVFRVLHIGEEQATDILVMATELVTNALQHAPDPYAFGVCVCAGLPPGDAAPGSGNASWLLCEVFDAGPAEPLFDRARARIEAEPEAGGRGLVLVRQLSTGHCGVRAAGTGKLAWFAVRLP